MSGLTLGQNMALSGVNGLIGIGNTMLQNHYNKQLAEYQNDYNLDMWNRQNEYNSPKETMNRLVEAGINPRAYQQIGQFANAGAPQPAAQMSKMSELSAFQSVVRQGLENQLLSEKVQQTKMDTSLKEIMTEKNQHQTAIEKVKYLIYSLVNGIDPQLMKYDYYTPDNQKLPLLPSYQYSDLYQYIQKGTTLNPYLRKHYLGNLLEEAGVDLRKLEHDLKSIEKYDYDFYGIRGQSDFMNTIRIIKNIFGL